MLIITKKAKDGCIRIGDDVEVVIVKVQGSKVRVGIKAPDSVKIKNETALGGQDGTAKG